jgi:hypothetical protein
LVRVRWFGIDPPGPLGVRCMGGIRKNPIWELNVIKQNTLNTLLATHKMVKGL